MARLIYSPFLLFTAHTTALLPDSNSQQPLVGKPVAVEHQPFLLGTHNRTSIWPAKPVTCTNSQAKLFVPQSQPHVLISTVLTIEKPKTNFKYCWFEFVAPAGAQADFTVTVHLLEAPLSCPDPGSESSYSKDARSWIVQGCPQGRKRNVG